jgi:hypothetical protein
MCLPIDLHGPAIVTKVRVVALDEQRGSESFLGPP